MQLFHESWADALRELIATCGGAKQIAARLWPEKTPDAAHRLLLDCLNETRPERLDPERLALLLRIGREHNCHAGVNWLMRDLGYEDVRAVEPADEMATLMRDYIAAAKSMQVIGTRIENLSSTTVLRKVA